MIVTLYTTRQFYKDVLKDDYLDGESKFGSFLRYYVKFIHVDNLPTDSYTQLKDIYETFPMAEIVQGERVSRRSGDKLMSWIETMRANPLDIPMPEDEEEPSSVV
jgi:hypothetical protein